MGSEQSSQPSKPAQRAPPVRRGHTIAVSNVPEAVRGDASGCESPGASVCSDSELPYISYTVNRPIGDSPKTSSRGQRSNERKSLLRRGPGPSSLPPGAPRRRPRDIVVVREQAGETLDEDIQRLQEIPTFLPIMRGALGLPGARDPAALLGLDRGAGARLACRLQAHVAASAAPLAADERALAAKLKETDTEISKLYSIMVEKQRANARHAERLARVHEVTHQLARCGSLLNQTLQDIEELNSLLPADKQLEPFVWDQR